jgi:hypothetical protein
MNIKRQERDDRNEPKVGRGLDSSSTEAGMIAGDAHRADIGSTVTPNRRLRNWILLANALAWLAIIVIVRWLFF